MTVTDDFTSSQALGWGDERFVDREGAVASGPSPPQSTSCHTDWSPTTFEVLGDHDETALFEPGSACSVALPQCDARSAAGPEPDPSTNASPDRGCGDDLETHRLATSLQVWLALARDPDTYDNVRVTAGARARQGEPGLRLDPDLLLQRVLDDIGPQPPPSSPTALALWGAALINPLPSLGVATEVRGAVLEAYSAAERVALVQRAVDRSIANLEGRKPLI